MANIVRLPTVWIAIIALGTFASCGRSKEAVSTEQSTAASTTTQVQVQEVDIQHLVNEPLEDAIRLIPGFAREREGPDPNQDNKVVKLFSFDRPDLGLSPREFYSALSILEYLVPEKGMDDPRDILARGITAKTSGE
ncbi:hypothetical protein MYX82_04760 [Acidobacteria bacterium AH-259-D05]|nr:hypothetical protein [Acidobacteria bacterium AH-259-D05]